MGDFYGHNIGYLEDKRKGYNITRKVWRPIMEDLGSQIR